MSFLRKKKGYIILLLLLVLVFFSFFKAREREGRVGDLSDVRPPEENRFIKSVLAEQLEEPMELALAEDGKIFWIERFGKINFYDPAIGQSKLLGIINVFTGNNDGLLGIALDPSFVKNQYIYLFYSPIGEIPVQHISRFQIKNDKVDLKSEMILLKIPTQREECCHSAGSLEFSSSGDLYIAVGDNTNPWAQEGYSPQDERKERSYFDAQRTAANTNDLRGKILRIHPEPEGTYSIPDGNLFPKDGSKGKPEIIVMGVRNPFRISVDSKTNYLFFGDIGPDANIASKRGPEAYDEINIAKNPGNFGWPYFVANNKAYPKFDFETNVIGPLPDSIVPINHSPNNSGQKILPQARKAMIWYSAEESKEFPGVGNGGRSAMAGPIYYYDASSQSEIKFPEYYDNKLFIYDWMRDWIKAVTLDKNYNYKSFEDFMPTTAFSSPIDMAFGKDGALYVLEYGSGWYSNNKDAKLSRITFNKGDRPPIAKAKASVYNGRAPLTVQFSSEGTMDYDGDELAYEWSFSDTTKIDSKEKHPKYIFEKPGIHSVVLKAKDSHGAQAKSTIEIIVGNTPPEILIEVEGNKMFYFEDKPVKYRVKVKDAEDGKLNSGIQASDVHVFLDYSTGNNLSPLLTGHQKQVDHPGKILIDQSDCKGCHLPDKSSVGPSFKDIALKYKDDVKAVDYLADKIIKGGSGVWTKKFIMVSHPQLTKDQASEMARYIRSFYSEQKKTKVIDPSGALTLRTPSSISNNGAYIITASYTDKGGEKVKPLTGSSFVELKDSKIQAENYSHAERVKVIGGIEEGNKRYLGKFRNGSVAIYKQLDFTDVNQIVFQYSATLNNAGLQIMLDSINGKVAAEVFFQPEKDVGKWSQLTVPFKTTKGVHDLFLVYKGEGKVDLDPLKLDWFQLKAIKTNNSE